jgi:hypothetical protein
VAVWSPTGSGGVHVDEVLTQISVGYPNEGLVAEALFPSVPVAKQSNKYNVFGREAWLPEDDIRAPGTEANEIPGMKLSSDTYYAQEHALQIAVTDEERENADPPIAPDRDGTELVTSKVLLGRELAMKNLVTTASNYPAGSTVTLSGTTQWSDYVNSNPIGDFKTANRAIHANIFLPPTVAVIPYQVMSVLEDHPDIIERIKYSERAILTQDILGAVLGLPGRVIVPGVGYQSAPGAAVGYLWGKDVLLAYVPPRAGMRIPAFAYEFTWTYGGRSQVVDRWREDKRKSDLIRLQRRYDLKLVAVDANGKSLAGYLIKNAVA